MWDQPFVHNVPFSPHLSVGQVGDGCFAGLSSCSAEFVESFGQLIGRRPVGGSRWKGKGSAVHFLEAVPKHRPIDFIHKGTVDADDVIR
ncbi:hypothetical protein A4G27_27255 [Mycobacterium kansasii]|nr:hypothetical protein A4G27_27255 [Mycobacterium kansasii]